MKGEDGRRALEAEDGVEEKEGKNRGRGVRGRSMVERGRRLLW